VSCELWQCHWFSLTSLWFSLIHTDQEVGQRGETQRKVRVRGMELQKRRFLPLLPVFASIIIFFLKRSVKVCHCIYLFFLVWILLHFACSFSAFVGCWSNLFILFFWFFGLDIHGFDVGSMFWFKFLIEDPVRLDGKDCELFIILYFPDSVICEGGKKVAIFLTYYVTVRKKSFYLISFLDYQNRVWSFGLDIVLM